MQANSIFTQTAVIVLATVLAISGCATHPAEPLQPPADLVWPRAPEVPRIRYLNSISRPEDANITIGAVRRFLDYMIGAPEKSMVTPYGIEADAAGRLYVVDTYLKIVHVFDTNSNQYRTFPTDGVAVTMPIDVAVDKNGGCLYLTDSQAGVVVIFDDFGKKPVGVIGKGVLKRPTGIAVNPKTDELLVVDTALAQILRYDLKNHRLKGKFGGRGKTQGRFHYPTNIWAAANGTILIADSLNFRIQVFAPDGQFLHSFGGPGDIPGYFTRPRGVAADSDGNIYVVDALFDNVQVFAPDGRVLMAFGGSGNGFGQFWLPNGIFIDSNDRIYVSDSYNKRIQVFQYIKR